MIIIIIIIIVIIIIIFVIISIIVIIIIIFLFLFLCVYFPIHFCFYIMNQCAYFATYFGDVRCSTVQYY